jgi:hypothetical protein
MRFSLHRASRTLKESLFDGAFEKAVFSLKMAPRGLFLESITGVFRGAMFTDEYMGVFVKPLSPMYLS